MLGQTDELISSNAEKMEMRVGAVAKLQGAIGGGETCKIILGLVRTPTIQLIHWLASGVSNEGPSSRS